MSKLTFSREPAVYVALVGAVLAAVINSGVSPELSANAAGLNSLIVLLCGIATRFLVTPNSSVPAASAPAASAPSATPAAPSA